ncbi:MAG: ribosome rescue protein RqcH [Desulfurococcaceae archaeon]
MLKKSMDIVDVYAWFVSNADTLRECFVDNAYRYKYAWMLKLRCAGTTRLLKIEPGQRVHFSSTEPGEKGVDRFAQFIRAHLRDGKVVELSMPWWERILVINVLRGKTRLRNYVELVPRGLWVVTSTDDKILYASRFEEFRDRAVKPGLHYKPPPPRGIPPWDEAKLLESLLEDREMVRNVVYNWGLPGYVAEELLLRAGLYEYKSKRPASVSRSDLEKIVQEYKALLKESAEGKGYLVYGSQGIEAYTPYKPRLFTEVHELEVKEVAKLDEALDIYFSELEAQQELLERAKHLEKELEAWRKRLIEHEKLVEEYRRDLEDVVRVLNLIYENYVTLENTVECARKARAERGWSAVRECGVESYDEKTGLIVVRVSGVELKFSVRAGFAEQVVELERKRGELEKKLERARIALEELKKKSLELEKELSIKVYTKPSPRYWYEKYRWSITRNGFLVVAGRDASQNESLVKKYLRDDYYFLHADIHGAPATVVIKHSGEPSREDLEDAAVIAACYSRAWKAGFSYVEVYWVHGKQVSKTPPAGEYLGKGAFMVYGERHYITVPLRLGVGLRVFCDPTYGDYVKVFAGNPSVVKETSLSYVVLVPGDEESNRVAEEVARLLSELASRKSKVRFNVKAEHVLEVLPGPSRIVEYGEGLGEAFCEETGNREEALE